MNSLVKINSLEKPDISRGHSYKFFQPKLSINPPDDQYEREADMVAENVMKKPINKSENNFFKPVKINSIQRNCVGCEVEDKLQRKESGNLEVSTEVQRKCKECEEDNIQRKNINADEVRANSELEKYVDNLNLSGENLNAETRNFFEPRFGFDLSNVKIHRDDAAAESAKSINALAYTSGNNIVFNENQYSPDSVSGKKLLAHELTHVIQQSNTGAYPVQKKDKIDTPPRMEDTPCERASLRREAKIPCPGEKGSELIIKPCIWTMFKNYGPCGVNIYPILKDTPTLKAYGELTEIESGEVKNVAAPKECIRFEVSCETNCDKTEDTRIRWGPPCAV